MMKGAAVLVLGLLFVFNVMLDGISPAFASEAEKGKKLYEEKKCGLCHIVAGKGGKMGPELTDEGEKRDRDWLTTFLKNPKGVVPGAKMMPVKGSGEEITLLVDYLLSLKK